MRALIALGVACGPCVPAVAADPPAKVDRYGDPLPSGALMRLGTLRTRAPITSFGIEKDGTVVTVGPGAEVRRWHAADDHTEEPIALPLTGPASLNNHPQVSADGRYVAACSAEKVFVWETPADAKAKPKRVAFDIANARRFRFSPDGRKLVVTAAGDRQSAVRVCDIGTGKDVLMDGGAPFIEGVNFSGDGARVAAAAGSEFHVWDAAAGKRLARFRTDGSTSSEFALDAAGDLLAARVYLGADRIEWRFFDTATGKRRDGLSGPAGGWCAAFAPDGKALLVADRDGVRLWDAVAGKVLRAYAGTACGYYGNQKSPARFSPDGKLLVAHNGNGLLRWNAVTGRPLFPEQDVGHGEGVSALGVSPDGARVATYGFDHRVCLWDAATAKLLWKAPAGGTHTTRVPFGPDGRSLYVGGPEWGEVTGYDAATGKPVSKFAVDPKEPKQASVNSLRASADGKALYGLSGAIGRDDPGLLTAWDAATGERTRTARWKAGPTWECELSPDGAHVSESTNGARGGVFAVAAPEKNLLAGTTVRGASHSGGQFSDDGKWLARVAAETVDGTHTTTAFVISTVTWKVVCAVPLTGHGVAAVSPDGRTLAVAAGDRVDLYDTTTANLLDVRQLPAGNWNRAHALCFSPDGTKLITGHADTTALVWPVPARPAK